MLVVCWSQTFHCAPKPGAGIHVRREHTLLYERLISTLTDIAPGIRLCSNASPETAVDALRRWTQPAWQ